MNIQIKDRVGFTEQECLSLVSSLLHNRKPEEGSFDYGGESHGKFGITVGIELPFSIFVLQTNTRKSHKSPIVIEIKKLDNY